MDKEFKTTFIPKKNPGGVKAPESKTSKAQRSLFGILALLLFVTAVVSTAGVYLYKVRLAAIVNSRIDSINRAEKAFEPAVILDLKKLDIRLRAGTELLSKHIAVSDFLESLGESTLPEVSFNTFSFEYEPDGSYVDMAGEARGYLQIAQQSDIFEDNNYIQNHIFSGFTLTETGRITFSLQFSLNPELLQFGRTIVNTEADSEVPDGVIILPVSDEVPAGVDINFQGLIQ